MGHPVEQMIRNQQVAGSNPAISSKKTGYSLNCVPFFCRYTAIILKHLL